MRDMVKKFIYGGKLSIGKGGVRQRRVPSSSLFPHPSSLKRGFTIVEMLVTIAILAVLMGIVTTAVSGMMKQSRGKRARAIIQAVQAGINAYHAANDAWPGAIDNLNSLDKNVEVLTDVQADEVIRDLVRESIDKNRSYLDVSGLFVALNVHMGCTDDHKSQNSQCKGNQCSSGTDFMTMWKGTAHRAKREDISSYCFGYPGKEYGKFCRLKITYNYRTDSVTVEATTQLD